MRHVGGTRLAAWLAALVLAVAALPAQAAVTITFWSHEFGNYFPHAFFTLRGVPDRGGPAVDASYGFTARSISPAILFGNVAGRVEAAKRGYMEGSHARFSRTISDAEYDQIVSLIREWSRNTGDSTYNLNKRNCVHFVREAARRVGLVAVDQPKLMKKPTSYLRAVAAGNVGRVTPIDSRGKEYLATLLPIEGVAPIAVPESTPGTMPGRKKADAAAQPRR